MADETVVADSAAEATDPADKASEASAKLKLKELSSPDDDSSGASVDDAPSDSGAESPFSPFDVAAASGSEQGLGGLRVTNRVLGIIALAALLLGALDLFATIQRMDVDARNLEPAPSLGSSELGEAAPPAPLPLAIYLAAFAKRPIVRDLSQLGSRGSAEIRVVDVKQPNWKKLAQEHFDLIGLSPGPEGGREAIVADRQAGRTIFLRAGQKVMAQEVELIVESVGSDHIVLAKNNDRLTIK